MLSETKGFLGTMSLLQEVLLVGRKLKNTMLKWNQNWF